MKNLKEEKDKVRLQIAKLKKEYSLELSGKSEEVLSVLEIVGVFQDAKHILIYNAMEGEVATRNFIERWQEEKDFYLPVTYKNDILFRKFTSETEFLESKFGVFEPIGEDISDYSFVDLVIVPGVAFDRKMNRVGYGKGYYDKFLSKINAPKVGICFDFQLLDAVPTESHDIKMDYLVSENDLIW